MEDLLVSEPAQDCKIQVGVFTFITPQLEKDSSKFFILCEEIIPENRSRNMEIYNRQLMEEWDNLSAKGYSEIKYLEKTPFPLW